MRSFEIQELKVLSRREKAARTVTFHPEVTVITGENDTGKSSLMKTLYWTLGAEPAKISDDWRNLDICAAVRIEFEGKRLTLVRHGRQFGVFDEGHKLVASLAGATREFGPYFARLLNFGLVLNNRATGEPEIPPPGYYLLPYYMDQDASWGSTWSGFANLEQYPNWRNDVAEYHVGFRDSGYYQLKARQRALASDMVEPERSERALANALAQVKAKLGLPQVDLNLDRFQSEIEALVSTAEALAKGQASYRQQMGELSNLRSFLNDQITLARTVLVDLGKDYHYALRQADEVNCPTCGAGYHNSVIERFALAVDQQRCEDLVVDLTGEVRDLDTKLDALNGLLSTERRRVSEIWEILATKREAVTLKEVIHSEARGEAIEVLDAELRSIRETLSTIAQEQAEADKALSQFESKGRRGTYLDDLSDFVARFSLALNVPSPGRLKSFAPRIAETGSDTPRAILAYQFGVLSLAWKRDGAVHAPLCIDSPNQQDQDIDNYRSMLAFLRDHRPSGIQLILALVDTQGISFSGERINLDKKRSVLDPSLYDTVGVEVQELVARMYGETPR